MRVRGTPPCRHAPAYDDRPLTPRYATADRVKLQQKLGIVDDGMACILTFVCRACLGAVGPLPIARRAG